MPDGDEICQPCVFVSCFNLGDFEVRGLLQLQANLKQRGVHCVLLTHLHRDQQPQALRNIPWVYQEHSLLDFPSTSSSGRSTDSFDVWLARRSAVWHAASEEAHLPLIDRSLAAIPACRSKARDCFSRHAPISFLAWCGASYPVSMIWQEEARRAGIPTFSFERGFLPGTWMVDAIGMGFSSDANRLPSLHALIVANHSEGNFHRYLAWYLAQKPSKYPATLPSKINVFWDGKPQRRIVYFGQLDAAGLLPGDTPGEFMNSPGYRDARQALMALSSACSQLPSCELFFRPHPLATRDLVLAAELGIPLVTEGSSRDVIERSAVVVCGLSTVQFEAVLLQRPVVLLANSALAGCDAAYDARQPERLADAIRQALEGVDAELRMRCGRELIDAWLSHYLYSTAPEVPACSLDRLAESLAQGAPVRTRMETAKMQGAEVPLPSALTVPQIPSASTGTVQIFFGDNQGIYVEEHSLRFPAPELGVCTIIDAMVPPGTRYVRLDPICSQGVVCIRYIHLSGGLRSPSQLLCATNGFAGARLESEGIAAVMGDALYVVARDDDCRIDLTAACASIADLQRVTVCLSIESLNPSIIIELEAFLSQTSAITLLSQAFHSPLQYLSDASPAAQEDKAEMNLSPASTIRSPQGGTQTLQASIQQIASVIAYNERASADHMTAIRSLFGGIIEENTRVAQELQALRDVLAPIPQSTIQCLEDIKSNLFSERQMSHDLITAFQPVISSISAESARLAQELQTQREALSAFTDVTRQSLEALKSSLFMEIRSMHAVLIDAEQSKASASVRDLSLKHMQDLLEGARARIDELLTMLRAVTADRDQLKQNHALQSSEMAALHAQIGALQSGELAALHAQVGALQARICEVGNAGNGMRIERDLLVERHRQLEARCVEAEARETTLRGSLSWRSTAPLRRIRRLLRGE
jgi:hypothetical protein